jgi:MFS family permease
VNSSSPLLALQHRNFALLWTGQLISVSGSMMQSAAILWHVSLLVPDDQKGLALGMVGLVRVLPTIAFSLFGGVIADAMNRRKVMLLAQLSMTVFAGLLAWFTLQGTATIWHLYLLTALGAAAGAIDNPARQSLFPNLVPREHLPNAISLNTIMFETAAVVGPTAGGLLIAQANVGWVYVFNAVSFLAVISSLLLMRNVPAAAPGSRRDISLGAALEGLRFVFREPLIRSTMLLDFFANFFASAIALLPIFATDILNVGPEGYGWLYAAPSLGALITSLVMVRAINRIENRGRVLLWSIIWYAVATIVFGLSRSFWLTFLCLAFFGASDTVSTVLRNIIRQLYTPDHMRGRMSSVNMIFFMGGPQLGEAEAGLVTDLFGAPISVVSGGIGALIATLYIARTTPMLRHYRREEPALPAGPGSQPASAD